MSHGVVQIFWVALDANKTTKNFYLPTVLPVSIRGSVHRHQNLANNLLITCH